MKSIETRFSERRPRLLGFLALSLAVGLLLGQHFSASRISYPLLLLLTGLAVVGALYIAFGHSFHRWFLKRTILERLSWRQVCLDVSLGLFICISSGLLEKVLR